uniref:Uncharacterized protein n=1 Tax=Rhizophora mucronata TaxID=61149 RepID=A0A2P2MII3_RHIMU
MAYRLELSTSPYYKGSLGTTFKSDQSYPRLMRFLMRVHTIWRSS